MHGDHDSRHGRSGRARRARPRPMWFRPVVAGAIYAVVAVAITAGSYLSEMSKISRGTASDTFSPFMYANVFTAPVSMVHSSWDAYPIFFNRARYREAVRQAVPPTLINVAVETLLIVLIGLAISARNHTLRQRDTVRADPRNT